MRRHARLSPPENRHPGAPPSRRRLAALSVALAALLPLPPAVAKEASSPQQVFLKEEGFPDITDADRALTAVDYAPGAPAAVLLEIEQNRWQGLEFIRLHYFRRVKILTDAGVEEHGDFTFELFGDWRVKTAEARTVLPDATEVDAADSIFREKSDSGYQLVRVAFPRVQAGAILDFHLSITADDALSVEPWVLQEDIPVLESRFVIVPPPGLRYRTFVTRMPQERLEPEEVRYGRERAFVWRFRNVEPLPDEPNLPPVDDIAQRLFVVLESYKGPGVYVPISTDWKSYNKNTTKYWNDWMKEAHAETGALARQAAEGASTSAQKAEAIRQALRQRVRTEYISDGHIWDSPDEVLAKGSGTTGEIAATAAAMLREVEVPAILATLRRRGRGMIPEAFPVPALFNDMLVAFPSEGGLQYFSPSADLAVGGLPWDCTGVLVVPLDGASPPVPIADLGADDNQVNRTVEATLSPDGSLAAEAVLTYRGVAAERYRRILRDAAEDRRRQRVERDLGRWMPRAQVTSLEILHLEDGVQDLEIRCAFQVDGFATPAGKRLLLNPVLFERVAAADWAAEQRLHPIHLGVALEEIDSVTIRLPEGTTGVTLPQPANLTAEPAGLYRSSYEREDDEIVLHRHLRLQLYSFPPASWEGLRGWFGTMAEADDRPVVVTLG